MFRCISLTLAALPNPQVPRSYVVLDLYGSETLHTALAALALVRRRGFCGRGFEFEGGMEAS